MGEGTARPLRALTFDPQRLCAALDSVPPGAWSLPSSYATTRVHHGYRRVVLVSAGHLVGEAEPFRFVFEELAPVHEAWLSWIDPGGFVVPHRDAGPWWERWQVPISAAGVFHGAESFVPTDGEAFQVEHWAPHAVTNATASPRIHLVVDRAVRLDRKAEPFVVYPVPVEMVEMVQRSLHGAHA